MIAQIGKIERLSRMTRLLVALILSFFVAPAAIAQDAQISSESQLESKDVIKLNTRLVNLNVSVMDRRGKKVKELKREDFLVFEDGVQQEVAYFDSVNAPINLVLLMDLSGSIGSKLDPVKKAAKRFIESLNKDDHVAVATFTSRFNLVSGFTTNKNLLKDRVNKIERPAGDTALYDAAWAVFDLLDQIKDGRKAVVVLTDGVDSSFHPEEEGSKHTFDELIMRAVEEDASVYPVYFDTEPETGGHYSAEAFSKARKQLQSLAEQTGGTYFSASRIEDLDGVYKQVAAELHSLYSLAYAAKDTRKDDRWRAIKVKVNREGVAAITKRGYYAK
jgi:Ca-activated chloride channel homolog